eukprot:TRINITY_DN6576_c0_g1_i1.p1 TRINITY_DN6576_c0_g1~~TRINITY_DN6576_c0_g1_i1.p1  ORF type:complete len:645 (+),score=85.43 TRINITY_DN6576_c0_g1_i1:266-2200(+)
MHSFLPHSHGGKAIPVLCDFSFELVDDIGQIYTSLWKLFRHCEKSILCPGSTHCHDKDIAVSTLSGKIPTVDALHDLPSHFAQHPYNLLAARSTALAGWCNLYDIHAKLDTFQKILAAHPQLRSPEHEHVKDGRLYKPADYHVSAPAEPPQRELDLMLQLLGVTHHSGPRHLIPPSELSESEQQLVSSNPNMFSVGTLPGAATQYLFVWLPTEHYELAAAMHQICQAIVLCRKRDLITRTQAVWNENGRYYLVLEKPFASLRMLLDHPKHEPSPWQFNAVMDALRLAEAMLHVHACGVVHGNLRPDHIFMAKGGAQLGSFEAGRQKSRYWHRDRNPHALAGKDDVFSFGIILFEMLVRIPRDAPSFYHYVTKHLDQVTDATLQKLISDCLAQRVTFAQIVDTLGQMAATRAMEDRMQEVASEQGTMFDFVDGVGDMPLVSLAEAVLPIKTQKLVPRIRSRARLAMLRFQQDPSLCEQLEVDEAAAIRLYTMEWKPTRNSVYYKLNQALREENREHLKPYFLYLRLLMHALRKLPPVQLPIIYRGIAGTGLNLESIYRVNRNVPWWGFSSCAETESVSLKFMGSGTEKFMFHIQASGVRIQQFSAYPTEKEVLLPPGRMMHVENVENGEITVVLLKEDESFKLFK